MTVTDSTGSLEIVATITKSGFTTKIINKTITFQTTDDVAIKKVKTILDGNSTKVVKVIYATSTVNASHSGTAALIKAELERIITSAKLEGVTIVITGTTTITTNTTGVAMNIALTKTHGKTVNITDWKVYYATA